jgi:hypothetical protein
MERDQVQSLQVHPNTLEGQQPELLNELRPEEFTHRFAQNLFFRPPHRNLRSSLCTSFSAAC